MAALRNEQARLIRHTEVRSSCSKLPALALLFIAVSWGATLPRLQTKTLTGHEVTLPDASHGRVAILIVGFTHASSKTTAPWTREAEKVFGSDPRYVVYSVAVLEDVPRFIRGMVVGSIRRDTPAARQDRFLTVFKDEKTWKQVAQYSAPNDAYIMALDANGDIRYQEHGLHSDAAFAKLREEAGKLLTK